jgi:hypothetical protein
MHGRALGLSCLLLTAASAAWADCSNTITSATGTTSGALQTSTDAALGCVVHDLYGPGGLTLANPFHSAHFDNSSQANLTPLNTAVGSQLSLLPLASPASGYTFTLDPATSVYTRSTQSFGPILSERAETIGRNKIFIGFTFQHYSFDKIDNFDIHNFPAVFGHIDLGHVNLFENDVITTVNNIDLTVNQSTIFGTVGLTNTLDVSVAVPIVNANMTATSTASIFRTAAPNPADPSADPVTGQFHYFDPADPNGSTKKTFVNSSSASGIGDVIIRAKQNLVRNDKAGIAVGVDVRLPTGDETNFLGSGAAGFKPFVIGSARMGPVSPHVNLGYQWNGDSVLAGDISTGMKASLPNQFFWTLGADVGAKRLTFAFDVLGERVMDAPRLTQTTFTTVAGALEPATTFNQISEATGNINLVNGSAGVKVSLGGNFLAIGNVLFKMNDGGLRANVSPMFGISYTH